MNSQTPDYHSYYIPKPEVKKLFKKRPPRRLSCIKWLSFQKAWGAKSFVAVYLSTFRNLINSINLLLHKPDKRNIASWIINLIIVIFVN